MYNVEFRVINRAEVGLLLGYSYFVKDNVDDFNELNIYLFFIVLHIKWW